MLDAPKKNYKEWKQDFALKLFKQGLQIVSFWHNNK